MNENEVYYIALAGLLHDIGKFADRACEYKEGVEGFHKDRIEKTINEFRDICQPSYGSGKEKKYTHEHAVITAALIKEFSECKIFPQQLSELTLQFGNEKQDFIRLSACHHKPESYYEKIISLADRLASGFERKDYEEYNKENKVKDYKKSRLYSVFENIAKDTNTFDYQYERLSFDKDSIFPKKNVRDSNPNEYKKHFVDFVKDAKKLLHKDNLKIWLEHFDSLYMIYTSNIPSFTVGYNPPFISLYDHSKTTAALASSLYLYYKNGLNPFEENDDKEIFLFVQGNFYGIQDFIFSKGGQTTKNATKILRGRSFYVSLLSELAANLVCEKIGLTPLSIIINAAGKFLIIADNSSKTSEAIKGAEKEIVDWIYKNFNMQISFGLVGKGASISDLSNSEKLSKIFEELAKESERKKYQKFDLFEFGGVIDSYPTRFNQICNYCGVRKINNLDKCDICDAHIKIGEKLVKVEKVAVTKENANLQGEKIKILNYEVYWDVSGKLSEYKDKLIKYWDISYESISKDITAKFINNYVAKNENSEVLTFEDLAKKSEGVNYISVLKGDVDNLGLVFRSIKNLNLSLYSAVSRQLNMFFSFYLPRYFNESKKNIYTVFAGGDDLFLIGPWNEIFELSKEISVKFKEYVCENKNISISMGLSLHKPKEPIDHMRIFSEEALEKSKNNEGKDSITVFDCTVKWNDFVNELYPKIKNFDDIVKDFSTVYLYKINSIIEMAEKEEKIKKNLSMDIRDISVLKWRALLGYYTVRNLKDKNKNVDVIIREMINFIQKHKINSRIPLWYVLYKNRKVKKEDK